MAETLKQTVDRLVRDALVDAKDMKNPAKAVRHAVCEAIRAALSEPTGSILTAAADFSDGYENLTGADVVRIFNGIAAERLKELG